MRCFVLFLALLSPAGAAKTQGIIAGRGANGWCKGMDSAPNASLPVATTAKECFDNCKATYNGTVAVDFWDINHPGRHAGNICWCQDKCDCLYPSLPDGGSGTLYAEDSLTIPASCGFNMFMIREAEAEHGWCRGSDVKLNVSFNNHLQCYEKCAREMGSVAVDYFKDRPGGKDCFCQDKCPCRSPSKVGGGDGYLVIHENTTPSNNLCYKMAAGVGVDGWCMGIDSAPNSSLPVPTTAAECYDNCKATYSGTIAVDFWDIRHPIRNAGNICWCQDRCTCTLPSKSDGGNGVLFLAAGNPKPKSCGFNMKTVVEGNDNAICSGKAAPASRPVGNMYACVNQCKADAYGDFATYYATDKACHCQTECPCKTASVANSGPGYLFEDEAAPMAVKCGAEMSCGAMKTMYKTAQCCGSPSKRVSLR